MDVKNCFQQIQHLQIQSTQVQMPKEYIKKLICSLPIELIAELIANGLINGKVDKSILDEIAYVSALRNIIEHNEIHNSEDIQ